MFYECDVRTSSPWQDGAWNNNVTSNSPVAHTLCTLTKWNPFLWRQLWPFPSPNKNNTIAGRRSLHFRRRSAIGHQPSACFASWWMWKHEPYNYNPWWFFTWHWPPGAEWYCCTFLGTKLKLSTTTEASLVWIENVMTLERKWAAQQGSCYNLVLPILWAWWPIRHRAPAAFASLEPMTRRFSNSKKAIFAHEDIAYFLYRTRDVLIL